MKRLTCQKCAAAVARATEASALLTHWQGRAVDLEAGLRASLAHLDEVNGPHLLRESIRNIISR